MADKKLTCDMCEEPIADGTKYYDVDHGRTAVVRNMVRLQVSEMLLFRSASIA